MHEPFEDGQLQAMTDLLWEGVPTELVIWATGLPYWFVEYAADALDHFNHEGE